MDEPRPPPAWTQFAARGVGFWILAGCLLKAFLGTPADLPEIVRRAPLPLGTTFALALGIEAFIGLATLLRPGRAWPLAELLLIAFSVVLVTQITAGAHSCGCFGPTIPVPPWLMLALDLVFTVLLFISCPWRLARGGRTDWIVAGAAIVFAVALPLAANREAAPGGAGTPTGLRRWTELDVAKWTGKKIRETDLAKWTDLTDARDGVWLIYRDSCEVCAECLVRMAAIEVGEREVTLVRLGEKPDKGLHRAVHVLPEGVFVHRIDLPDTVDWVVTAPARMIVEDGVVKSAAAGLEADDCK